jgi:hypothetical protein
MDPPRRVVAQSGTTALAFALCCLPASAQGVQRASVDSTGAEANDYSSYAIGISEDGGLVLFSSHAWNLVANDLNGWEDVFVHDFSTGTTELVSVDSSGKQGNSDSGLFSGAISADGQVVAFVSWATNLVTGDKNGVSDIFVHDRSTGVTERVSVNSSGGEANGPSDVPALSADGRYVAFECLASNLVSGDHNGVWDIFVHDRSTGATQRVSVDSSGVEGNGHCYGPSISRDGQVVAFGSEATNLVSGDTNRSPDVFVHDRGSGATEIVSVSSQGVQGSGISSNASVSGDGAFVAFSSLSNNLVPSDTNGFSDVFVRDRSAGTTERVSVDSSGGQANEVSDWSSISSDGQVVAFSSAASNLVAGDANQSFDVFVRDRAAGTTEVASIGRSGGVGNDDSGDSGLGLALSGNGMVVAFESVATDLVSGDTNGTSDIFVGGCNDVASWSNYGAGFPGTNGVPSFTSIQNPVVGATITLDLANSSGAPTVGLLFLGFSEINLPTSWGGDLLVLPALTVPITFSFGFDSFTGATPDDPSLCGLTVDLQAIEADPGAAKGVSFTQGLELDFGR